MNEEQYIVERVEEQICWYDKKSLWNQKWYKILRSVEITVSISIPLLASLNTSNIYSKILC